MTGNYCAIHLDSPFYFVAAHSQCSVKVKFPSVMEFFLLCFKQVLQNIFPPCSLSQTWLKVWFLPSLTSVCPIYFILAVLSLTLYHCLCLPEYYFAGSSVCPSLTSCKEAAELLIKNRNLLCFNFVAMLKAWRIIDWYRRVPVICLDPRLLVIKFCFHFFILQNHSFTKKRHTDAQKQVICVRRCKNAQVAQKRALEWTLGLFPFIHTAAPLHLHEVLHGQGWIQDFF